MPASTWSRAPPISPPTFTGPWTEISPNPIVQVTRGTPSFEAVSGRVGALAIRPSNGRKILGAAQGGIWTYDAAPGSGSPDRRPAVPVDRRARGRSV